MADLKRIANINQKIEQLSKSGLPVGLLVLASNSLVLAQMNSDDEKLFEQYLRQADSYVIAMQRAIHEQSEKTKISN